MYHLRFIEFNCNLIKWMLSVGHVKKGVKKNWMKPSLKPVHVEHSKHIGVGGFPAIYPTTVDESMPVIPWSGHFNFSSHATRKMRHCNLLVFQTYYVSPLSNAFHVIIISLVQWYVEFSLTKFLSKTRYIIEIRYIYNWSIGTLNLLFLMLTRKYKFRWE